MVCSVLHEESTQSVSLIVLHCEFIADIFSGISFYNGYQTAVIDLVIISNTVAIYMYNSIKMYGQEEYFTTCYRVVT